MYVINERYSTRDKRGSLLSQYINVQKILVLYIISRSQMIGEKLRYRVIKIFPVSICCEISSEYIRGKSCAQNIVCSNYQHQINISVFKYLYSVLPYAAI